MLSLTMLSLASPRSIRLRSGRRAAIHIDDDVVRDQQPLTAVLRRHCRRGQSAERVAGDRNIARAVEHDARAGVTLHRTLARRQPLVLPANVAVAEIVS